MGYKGVAGIQGLLCCKQAGKIAGGQVVGVYIIVVVKIVRREQTVAVPAVHQLQNVIVAVVHKAENHVQTAAIVHIVPGRRAHLVVHHVVQLRAEAIKHGIRCTALGHIQGLGNVIFALKLHQQIMQLIIGGRSVCAQLLHPVLPKGQTALNGVGALAHLVDHADVTAFRGGILHSIPLPELRKVVGHDILIVQNVHNDLLLNGGVQTGRIVALKVVNEVGIVAGGNNQVDLGHGGFRAGRQRHFQGNVGALFHLPKYGSLHG